MDDLTGTADERIRRLAAVADPDAAWLRRQLENALAAWAEDETELDIDREARTDY
ncbi:MAG: hypothetical protein KKH51_11980 [Actinobacteria bacterium]|nr:hypothetical protein [Actinomycetota bacterium]